MTNTTMAGKPAAPLINLQEYEAAARTLLPTAVFDFIAGGSGDEVTLRASRASFEGWRLLPWGCAGCVNHHRL
jgi:hypothetical protein